MQNIYEVYTCLNINMESYVLQSAVVDINIKSSEYEDSEIFAPLSQAGPQLAINSPNPQAIETFVAQAWSNIDCLRSVADQQH